MASRPAPRKPATTDMASFLVRRRAMPIQPSACRPNGLRKSMDLGVGKRQDRVLCGAPSPSRLYEESCHVAQRESDVSERSVHPDACAALLDVCVDIGRVRDAESETDLTTVLVTMTLRLRAATVCVAVVGDDCVEPGESSGERGLKDLRRGHSAGAGAADKDTDHRHPQDHDAAQA